MKTLDSTQHKTATAARLETKEVSPRTASCLEGTSRLWRREERPSTAWQTLCLGDQAKNTGRPGQPELAGHKSRERELQKGESCKEDPRGQQRVPLSTQLNTGQGVFAEKLRKSGGRATQNDGKEQGLLRPARL